MMKDEAMKYGVNIDLANETKREMANTINAVSNNHILNKIGAFASLYDFNFKNIKEPVLVLKTEEPGSKQLLAVQYDKIENVCYDMINHLINDCIVMGAMPLAVQDAIICGRMDKGIVTRIVKAISLACEAQGCSLTGGETSEQPGVLDEKTYILTSSIVGVVEKSDIIDGSTINENDVIISLASSGIHTNGYTLVRSIMKNHPKIMGEIIDGNPFIDAVLIPHRCYYRQLYGLFDKKIIHGLAHITGGGICENLNRILPKYLDAKIELNKYCVPSIFKVLKGYGNVDEAEMIRTFNLGVGMALVTSEDNKKIVMEHLIQNGLECYEIGKIVKGNGKVLCEGIICWE